MSEEQKTIWLFGEMEIDPELTHKEMYKKACDIAEQCGYLATTHMTGGTKVILVYDNDAMRYFRLLYEQPHTDDELSEVWYSLTKIEEWRRGQVWTRNSEGVMCCPQ